MTKRNFGLDVVRMCAIVPVLAVHYCAFALKNVSPLIYIGGDMGVEIFFALSGFLIGGIILRDFEKGFSARVAFNFYVRRWMRTLPLYYVFFGLSAFVTIYGLTLDHAWTAKCFAYLVFMQDLAWPMLAEWYHESWSLAVEEWFYLLFPILFASLIGLRASNRVFAIALILIMVPLALRVYFFDPSANFDTHVRKIVLLRLDSIAFGILAIWAVTAHHQIVAYWRNVIAAVGVVGITLMVMMLRRQLDLGEYFLRTYSLTVLSASFAAIVVWAYFQSWKHVENRSEALIVSWFSTRSYALYLCHGSVVRTMLRHGFFAKPPVISFIIFAGSSLALAEIAHRVVERPLMRLRPREIRTERASVPLWRDVFSSNRKSRSVSEAPKA